MREKLYLGVMNYAFILYVYLECHTYCNGTIIGHSLFVAAPLRFQVRTHILARDYSRVPNTSVGQNKSVD